MSESTSEKKRDNYFAKNLKTLRKLEFLTQQQLADALGIKRSSISAYEEGRAQPDLLRFMEICDLFSIHPKSMLSADLSEIL